MLSYQHAYHAGNAADVHKHALLASALHYMAQKDKSLVYMETHAGRALYDLSAPEAKKTGEAVAGIGQLEENFAPDHPYRQALAACRASNGPQAYPGSPWIARQFLRANDSVVLCERHPGEARALRTALPGVRVLEEDGPAAILSRCPPKPRRGLLLIDPSYEVKTEWQTIPKLLASIHQKWPTGVLMLWSPILNNQACREFTNVIENFGAVKMEIFRTKFPPARADHKMQGSQMTVINPPYGLSAASA